MKALSLITSLFLLLTLMGACTGGPVTINSTGMPGEIVVVMNKAEWDGPAGEALKDVLTTPVIGLPQVEPSLSISYTPPKGFDGILRVVRNILIVNIDPSIYTKASMKYTKDEWAKNQTVLRIQAPDVTAFDFFISQNAESIVDLFVKQELVRTRNILKKTYNNDAQVKIKDKFGIDISVPEDMKFGKDTTDFIWVSNNANTGRRDMIIYSFPYTDANTFTKEYLIAKRDSVLKANIPGGFPGSYMTTETLYDTQFKPLSVNGKYVAEMKGLWKMVGDMMGGPFVSHARVDEKNHRVIVAEGLVYAPETKKRNHIWQVEGALYTMTLPGDKPEEEAIVVEEEK